MSTTAGIFPPFPGRCPSAEEGPGRADRPVRGGGRARRPSGRGGGRASLGVNAGALDGGELEAALHVHRVAAEAVHQTEAVLAVPGRRLGVPPARQSATKHTAVLDRGTSHHEHLATELTTAINICILHT